MTKYKDICRLAYEANMDLPRLGLVMFTFGNVSAADHNLGVFAIKPSGVPYVELSPEKMVVVDFDGRIVEGSLNPSSDTPTHAFLYKTWVDINGIAHTHSTFATSWAQSLRDIPIYGTTHADHIPCDIPCALPLEDKDIRDDYEAATGRRIADCINDRNLSHRDVEMILVGNHGPFTWAKTAQKAVYNSAVLEELAKMALITEIVNPDSKQMKATLINKHFERKHGAGAYYGQK